MTGQPLPGQAVAGRHADAIANLDRQLGAYGMRLRSCADPSKPGAHIDFLTDIGLLLWEFIEAHEYAPADESSPVPEEYSPAWWHGKAEQQAKAEAETNGPVRILQPLADELTLGQARRCLAELEAEREHVDKMHHNYLRRHAAIIKVLTYGGEQ